MPRPRKSPFKPTSRTYSVYFLPDEDVGGYTAHIPALGIVTEGESLVAAKAMAKDAIAGWMEAAQQLGKSIPHDVTTDQVEVSA
jgi:predicted RNase H-like HicB family nuclease